MPHIPSPTYPPPTILETIGNLIQNIADDFYDLYERLEDVWLIGQYLRWPFWWMWFYFNNVSDNFYLADRLIRELKRWIDGLTEGNVFVSFLDWISSQYRSIRLDPIGWVRGKFTDISHEAWQIVHTPITFVSDRLRSLIPWWDDFRYNPTQFVIDRLTIRHPWLNAFFSNALAWIVDNVYAGIGFIRQLRDNPQDTIINWLSLWYSWIRSFLSNPVNFIVDRLKSYSVEVRLMIEDPYAWVREKIKGIMGWSDIDISDLGFYIFNRFLQRANDYVERRYSTIREVAISIIMRYM